MRNRVFTALLISATLPLAAGFAFSEGAFAQDGMMYQPPVSTMVTQGAMGNPVELRISGLEQQIRDLTNQLEERDNQLRQLQSKFDKFSADTSMRLQDIEAKTGGAAAPLSSSAAFETRPSTAAAATPPADVPPAPVPVRNSGAAPSVPAAGDAPVNGALVDPNGAFQPSATPALGQINETAPNNNGGNVTAGKPQTSNAAQAYDQAFSYLQKSNYSDAQRAFQDFLKTYPTHALAANAQYWLGETYFAQTQYSTAAKTFAKAFQEHPNGQKAPDSLLKLALTLEKLNKKPDACLTLQELNKRFTAGPASVLQRAAEEGKRMGCQA